MKTILFCVLVVLSVVSWFISLVSYFCHDDIKRKRKIEQIECDVSYLFKYLIPLEVCIQAVITIVLLYNKHYILFAINVPVLLYNIKMELQSDFDYSDVNKMEMNHPQFQRNCQVVKAKLVFYILLVILLTIVFLRRLYTMVSHNMVSWFQAQSAAILELHDQ